MQRERQLDHAEVRPEMPAVSGEHGDQLVSNFLGKLLQLLASSAF